MEVIASSGLAELRLRHFALAAYKGPGMTISSALCRTQEAVQRERAEQATLEDVRVSATRAVDAWRREEVGAQARERRELARFRAKFAGALDPNE